MEVYIKKHLTDAFLDATPMIPGGNNGLGGKFKIVFVYYVDTMETMDAVDTCIC